MWEREGRITKISGVKGLRYLFRRLTILLQVGSHPLYNEKNPSSRTYGEKKIIPPKSWNKHRLWNSFHFFHTQEKQSSVPNSSNDTRISSSTPIERTLALATTRVSHIAHIFLTWSFPRVSHSSWVTFLAYCPSCMPSLLSFIPSPISRVSHHPGVQSLDYRVPRVSRPSSIPSLKYPVPQVSRPSIIPSLESPIPWGSHPSSVSSHACSIICVSSP